MITGMNHVTLAVQDIEKSFDFYHHTLGLKPLVRWDKGAYFLVGDFWFCLNVDGQRAPNACYTHCAFSISQESFNALSEKIRASGATVYKENSSPGDSFYFLDPDGHKLEIHTSNWKERLRVKKENPGTWRDVVWFD